MSEKKDQITVYEQTKSKPAQSAISACKSASSSSSAVRFWGAGFLPAGTCTGAAGAVVAGWRSCSSNSAPSSSSSSASNSSWKGPTI